VNKLSDSGIWTYDVIKKNPIKTVL